MARQFKKKQISKGIKWLVPTKHYEIRAIPSIHFVLLLLIFASSNLTLKKIGLYDILQNAFLMDYQEQIMETIQTTSALAHH